VRILLVHNRYRERGGEDQVFETEIDLLEAHGHEVQTYVRSNDEIDSPSNVTHALDAVWNRTTYRQVHRLLDSQQFDVVHVHNTLPLISPSVFYAARDAGVPAVQTLHNYRLLCPSAMFLRNGELCEACLGKRVAWPGVLHACYRSSHAASAVVATMLAWHHARGTFASVVSHFITLSEFARTKHIEGGIPADRMSVRPNYLAHDPGVGDGNGGYALFVGRLANEKGIDTLLDAWAILAGRIPLRVVGDGPLATKVAAATRATPGVTWLGRLERHEALKQMQGARFVILPSYVYEAFPLTAVEAFATGTPVIASDVGVLREIVREGETGARFPRSDAAGLAHTVSLLLQDQQAYGSLRRSVRATFLAEYTAERAYERLVAIYARAGVHAA